MNPLLEAIMKASAAGVAQQQSQQAPAGDPMAEMLKGILGGGGAPSQRQAQAPAMPQGGGGIQDLIGSLIGGNASQGQPHHNGIADIIGSIMGGGGTSGASANPLVNPIANMLAQKLGIPPALAQAAVAFFMTKMFQRQMASSSPSGSGGGFSPGQQSNDSLDLDDLLDSMGDSESLGLRFSNSGMDKELSEKTGMSSDQANKALQEIVNIFGQQRGKPNPVTTRGAELKGLLDAWD